MVPNTESSNANPMLLEGQKSQALDASFFSEGTGLSARPFVGGHQFTRAKLYPHQNAVTDDGKPLSGRKARLLAVLNNNPEALDTKGGKKHHKGNKRAKQRSGKGYD